jgi:hypothetical protein
MIDAMIAHDDVPMLYGVARNTAADTTATSWYGKFVLTGVNSIGLIKQKAEMGKKGEKAGRKARRIK